MKNLLKNLFLFSFVYLALCLVFSCKKEGEGTFKIVFYPNESGESMKDAREAFKDILQKALEREVEVVTTTHYNIALETLISGKANMAYVGAEGYIQAHNKNKSVIPVATNSGASGTLSDSLYSSGNILTLKISTFSHRCIFLVRFHHFRHHQLYQEVF